MKKNQSSQSLKKMKKLRKIRIWPSVFFIFFSFLLTLICVMVFESLFVMYVFQEKFENAIQDAKFIQTTIEINYAESTSYQNAFEVLKKTAYASSAVAILDENNKIVADYGNPSFDLDRQGTLGHSGTLDHAVTLGHTETLGITDEYRFYFDQKSSGEIFDHEGQMVMNLRELTGRCFSDVDQMDRNWMKEELYHESYWISVPEENSNSHILVKTDFCLYRRDVIFICGIGSGIVVAMGIPLLLLLIHTISGILRQKKMYSLIYMDPVTGGYNGFYFNSYSEKKLNYKRNADKTFAIIYFSYTKYKSYCSCHSTQDGEKLLQDMEQYLSQKLQKKEICSHVAEGDFAILLSCDSKEEVYVRVQSWLEEMKDVFPKRHSAFRTGICMIYPVSEQVGNKKIPRNADVSQLYHYASIARDTIGASQDHEIIFFDEEMQKQRVWEHHVEENMERALAEEEFQVYLQPKYDPVSNRVVGAEALVRWINGEDGFIPPGRFIPIFENNGFITKLDDYMISHVAALQAKWLAEGKEVVTVSVNVSRAHFTKPDLAKHICKLVDAYNLPHHLLEIELTESAFFDDKDVLLRTVNTLKEYGFYVSMDDFGSGYSSLNSLKDLPLDVLKLDAEFFRGDFQKERGEIVVSEAIHLAKKLNMKIVAEGIENKNQVDFLAENGCDMIQGYYFAKPMPYTDFENAIA